MNRGFVTAYHVLWLWSSHLTLGLCFVHRLEWRGEVAHLPLRKLGGPHAWEASSISFYPLWCHFLIIPRLQGFADENEHSETKSSHFNLVVVQSLGHVWLCDPMDRSMPARFNLEEYICTHCYILKQITNEDLPYSAGNPTQYPVKTYMGKELEKE